ncbi:unnamed protein product [Diatraea saccharalis]|uniref:Uncharacterized protein n=1 Tax=Diatraea saccharalis TaxID=40085 RepID=A0A9N9QXT4_9NEOP|nr:unnamed protein product [Diatraea saccharalis]
MEPAATSTDDDDSQLSSLPPNNDDHEVTDEDIAGLLRQRPHTVPHAEILRAVYDRVNDVSSTLRTRALAILTDCVASERPPMKEALRVFRIFFSFLFYLNKLFYFIFINY